MILFRDRAATVMYEVLETLDKSKKFLLPLNICPIVPDTFLKANIKFKFIDININTLCMDEDLALEAIRSDSSIGGVLLVKTFGIKVDSEVFYQKIKDINPEIFIIDDQCPSVQNFDFDIDNSFASLTLFSSGYSKYVDIGYGGFGFLKDEEFKDRFKDDSKNRIVLHSLRHTFASHLALQNVPLYTIKELMHHADISMTLRYAKLSQEAGENAVKRLGL